MFLFHAITEASFALPHNVVNVDDATTLQQRIKTSSAFGEKRQSPSLHAGLPANFRSKRALNKSMKRTTKSVAAYLSRYTH